MIFSIRRSFLVAKNGHINIIKQMSYYLVSYYPGDPVYHLSVLPFLVKNPVGPPCMFMLKSTINTMLLQQIYVLEEDKEQCFDDNVMGGTVKMSMTMPDENTMKIISDHSKMGKSETHEVYSDQGSII